MSDSCTHNAEGQMALARKIFQGRTSGYEIFSRVPYGSMATATKFKYFSHMHIYMHLYAVCWCWMTLGIVTSWLSGDGIAIMNLDREYYTEKLPV